MSTANTNGAPPEGAPQESQAEAVVMTPEHNATRETDSQEHHYQRQPNTVPDIERTRAILRGELDPSKEPSASAADAPARRRAGDDAEDLSPFFDEDGNFLDEEPKALEAAARESATAAMAEAKLAAEEAASTPGRSEAAERKDHGPSSAEEESQSPTTPEEATEEDQRPGPRKRISITRNRLGDRDFAAVQLADREQISIPDAYRRLYGDESLSQPLPPGGEAAAAGAPAAPAVPTPERIQSEIDSLLGQRKAASKTLDLDRAHALNDRINDLRDLKRDAQQAVDRAQEEFVHSYREAVIAAADHAVDLYPAAGAEGSQLFSAIDAARIERQRTDPDFFRSTNWPKTLAVEIAGALGIAPAVRKSADDVRATARHPAQAGPYSDPAAPLAPRKAARPAPPAPAPGNASAAASVGNAEAALRAELQAARRSNDLEQVRAVGRKVDAYYARAEARR